MFLLVAPLLLLVGCRAEDLVQPELEHYSQRIFTKNVMDCQMDAARCSEIQAGIDEMKGHANSMCRVLGGLAQARFDAAPGTAGYRDQPQVPNMDMSVNNPSDGYPNVYPSFWVNPFIGQPVATGALVIHEEKHHQGAGETEAQAAQDACLNPQP